VTTPGAAAVASLHSLQKNLKMIRFSSDPLAQILERLAQLEADVSLLKQRNAVTRNVTHNVTDAVTRNAERQRRYRERKKAKSV